MFGLPSPFHIGRGLTKGAADGGGFPIPRFDLNFVSNAYSGDTLANMAAEAGNFVGGIYEREDSGLIVAVAANAPQVSPNGLEVWPSRKNLALQVRDITSGTWTKTGVTATRTLGRNGGANQASRCTVTANGGIVTQAAAVQAIGDVIGAVDLFKVSGSGTVEMSIDGQANWVVLGGITGAYKRIPIPPQNLANPQVAFRFSNAGDVFDLDWVTMQTGNWLGPRVTSVASAVNTPQNRLTCLNKPPIRDFIKGGVYAVLWEGKMSAAGGRGLFVSDNNFNCSVNADGSVGWGTAAAPAGTFKFDAYQKVAISRDVAGNARLCINGGTIYRGAAASSPIITHFDWGTNGAGVFNMRGVLRRTAFYDTFADSQMVALSAN
ncbi:hypothetical protein NL532_32035 [Mesorhizobium sp. C120A]|uniref:hypothetical protein n=1 Tax=unclassified Mesorhizobium TaxID=325217 RepID=UPI0003CFBB3C|nr:MULTISPECIES: hypothetical protein [unclassified Mesorhizobium]ESZ63754.1 hypothetical protein X728_09020 [Mesorhizobium sp. L103C120A0]WJI45073.1 hypothetical protein NL532_32035 [Mesorhizobium sp. C120A]